MIGFRAATAAYPAKAYVKCFRLSEAAAEQKDEKVSGDAPNQQPT